MSRTIKSKIILFIIDFAMNASLASLTKNSLLVKNLLNNERNLSSSSTIKICGYIFLILKSLYSFIYDK